MARRITNINHLNKDETIKKIINQANSLNKKIKAFNDENITEYQEYINNYIQSKYHSSSGRITKSKKVLEQQNIVELKQLLSSLIQINNNETYGTINKYKKVVSKSIANAKDTFKDYLIDKGYDEHEVELVINSGTFLDSVSKALNDMGGGYGSNQTMEKVFLEYSSLDADRSRAMSDVEFGLRNARELAERLETERQLLEELHRSRKLR